MAEEKELTHAQKVQRHFDIIGKPNPFARVHSAQARARESGGCLGSNKGAARYERTSAEDRRKANTDGKFGYFDEVNKRYVPALFDAIDGGGRDTRGDKFKGGMFSELLNDLGVDPYGSQRDRMFVNPNTSPLVQAVARSDAAMANQEASFDQPSPTPMTAQEMSFTQPSPTPMSSQEMSFTQPSPTSMTAQEMSFTQPNPFVPNFPDEVSGVPFNNTPNPFTGPTYDMVMDQSRGNMSGRNVPRVRTQQLNSVTGGALGGGNMSGRNAGRLNQLRSESATGGAISSPDDGFNRFLEVAKNDRSMMFLLNDLPMAKNVYDAMVARGINY
jgi:hypothetical protein